MASGDSRQLAKTLLEKAAGDEATLRAIAEIQEVPDIDRLVELVETEGLELSASLREAGQLTPWALAHRYESAPARWAPRGRPRRESPRAREPKKITLARGGALQNLSGPPKRTGPIVPAEGDVYCRSCMQKDAFLHCYGATAWDPFRSGTCRRISTTLSAVARRKRG